MHRLERARLLLAASACTCVLCSDSSTLTSTLRGVAPLLQWLDAGRTFPDYAAADRVVGSGAAFLYILLGIRAVHAEVISRPALDLLLSHGIDVTFTQLTDGIINRAGTGTCPIESAVRGLSDPAEALAAIRRTLLQLNAN
ncbi:MAG: DUF1893 domain-containing protein [Oscillospiraceae bacterium]|nr:DUF1893 domain-containing protein [Oscillospiraceae bacterium]